MNIQSHPMTFYPPQQYHLRSLQNGDGNALASALGSRGDNQHGPQGGYVILGVIALVIVMGALCICYMSRRAKERIQEEKREQEGVEKSKRDTLREACESLQVTMKVTEENLIVRSRDDDNLSETTNNILSSSNSTSYNTESESESDSESLVNGEESKNKVSMADSLGVSESLPPTTDDVELTKNEEEDHSSMLVLTGRRHGEQVSGLCAICLENYKPGDSVVCSSNEDCSHVFHQDCILDYWVKMKEENATPCPMCRQHYLMEAEQEIEV